MCHSIAYPQSYLKYIYLFMYNIQLRSKSLSCDRSDNKCSGEDPIIPTPPNITFVGVIRFQATLYPWRISGNLLHCLGSIIFISYSEQHVPFFCQHINGVRASKKVRLYQNNAWHVQYYIPLCVCVYIFVLLQKWDLSKMSVKITKWET